MKIVVLDGYTENPGDLSWEDLGKLGNLTVYDRTPLGEIIARIGDAEAVITNKTPLNAAVFEACPNMKYVGMLSTGYNVVDVDAAKAHGVVVSNIPTYGTTAVAQFVFALLLELCHHVGAHSEAVRGGAWSNSIDWSFWNYPLIELADKTLGIIGFGRIGYNAAKIAVAFGMKVVAFDEYPRRELETNDIHYVTLDELLAQSDIISLHCPLFPSTKGMINKDSIAKMKDGVMIINTSRGPLIVEEDLVAALNSGKVAGAAVDVVSVEPIPADSILLTAKNCIVTPHIAWAPKESRQRLMNIAVENLLAFQEGRPKNIVNP